MRLHYVITEDGRVIDMADFEEITQQIHEAMAELGAQLGEFAQQAIETIAETFRPLAEQLIAVLPTAGPLALLPAHERATLRRRRAYYQRPVTGRRRIAPD